MTVQILQASKPGWPLNRQSGPFDFGKNSNSLAETLLAIQKKRGALYMLDTSRCLIEKWDLRSDQLDSQSEETWNLVASLLKV